MELRTSGNWRCQSFGPGWIEMVVVSTVQVTNVIVLIDLIEWNRRIRMNTVSNIKPCISPMHSINEENDEDPVPQA